MRRSEGETSGAALPFKQRGEAFGSPLMSQASPKLHLALQSLLLRKWSQRAQKVTCQQPSTPLQFDAAFSWRLPRLLRYASWPSQTGAQLTTGSRSSPARLAAPSKINRPRPPSMPEARLHQLRWLNFEAFQEPSWGSWKGEPATLKIKTASRSDLWLLVAAEPLHSTPSWALETRSRPGRHLRSSPEQRPARRLCQLRWRPGGACVGGGGCPPVGALPALASAQKQRQPSLGGAELRSWL